MRSLTKWILNSVLLLVVVLIVSGCGNGDDRSSSVDGYVAKEIKKYSGLRPKPVNDPAYRLPYTSKSEDHFESIRIEGDHIETMKRMLREMLGEPTLYQEGFNLVKYNLPKDVVLECYPEWDIRDEKHRWVVITINAY
jgi:hypothetical protein